MAAELLGTLCGETVALMHRLWGKGPTKCRAFWAGPDTLLVVLADGLTAAEQTAIEAGRGREALAFRGALHEVLNDRMKEIVERLSGRTVEAAMSTSHTSPDLTALVFVLAPGEAG